MQIIRQWLENREEMLRQKRREQAEQALFRLSFIPEGRALADLAEEKKIIFRVTSDLPPNTAAVYTLSRFVNISPRLSDTEMVLAIVHELRHAWQEKEHLVLRRKTSARDNVVMVRFAEADAYAYEAQVAWKLTQQGFDERAWKTFNANHFTLARAYESAVQKNTNPVTAAFQAFFEDAGLKNDYDRDALGESRKQIERVCSGQRANTAFDKIRAPEQPPLMSVGHLREFGRLPDGTNYLADVNTRLPVYVTQLSPRNARELERLEKRALSGSSQKTSLKSNG